MAKPVCFSTFDVKGFHENERVVMSKGVVV